MSVFLFVELYVIFQQCKSSYFLCSNPLRHLDAGFYCQSYCLSNLVSIHNKTQNSRIIEIVKKSYDISSLFDPTPYNQLNIYFYDIWTGLYRVWTGSTMDFAWTDGASFDYGTISGEYPWQYGNPDNYNGNEMCVNLWTAFEYQWNDYICDSPMRFICNKCVGKMNKYIVISPTPQLYTKSKAQSFCKGYLGTDLASIHSEDDYQQTKLLCEYQQNDIGCWIGLDNIDKEDEWKWEDGTIVDFANDTNGGVYPWGSSPDLEPNNAEGNENCVILSAIHNYEFNDRDCSAQHNFICNMPSELCVNSSWSYQGDFKYSPEVGACGMYSASKSQSIINSKQWIYDDREWVIEYVYTIHEVQNTGYGESGILIYHFDTICNYYWVGLAINNDQTYIFIYKYIADIKQQIYYSSALFKYQYDTYYTLRVNLVYGEYMEWNIMINGQNISYNDITSNAYINHTKFIGLKNDYSNITGKSLFVSDTPTYNFTADLSWGQCTDAPTTYPTTEPTVNPSTLIPSTAIPTNIAPTTSYPTTAEPTSNAPTTTTTSPTTATPTTVSPTTRPTTSNIAKTTTTFPTPTQVTKHFTITIGGDISDIKENEIKGIITKSLNISSDYIISTKIKHDSIIVFVSIPSHVVLDEDIINEKVEEGLVKEYGEDIDVSVIESKTDNDIDENNERKKNDIIALMVGIMGAIIFCFILSVVVVVKIYKAKQRKAVNMETIKQIEMMNEPGSMNDNNNGIKTGMNNGQQWNVNNNNNKITNEGETEQEMNKTIVENNDDDLDLLGMVNQTKIGDNNDMSYKIQYNMKHENDDEVVDDKYHDTSSGNHDNDEIIITDDEETTKM